MQHHHANYRLGVGWATDLPQHLDSPQTLVTVFAAPEMQHEDAAFAALAHAFPNSVIVGCSTAGEIADACVNDTSLSVGIARFDKTPLRRAITPIHGAADSFNAGVRLASQLAPSHQGQALQAVFLLSDGLNVNGTPLVAGLAAGVAKSVCITGGLAGDGSRFGHTWVLDGTARVSGHVCAVGLYGPHVRVGHGCDAGWLTFGPERRITKSSGNVLYELDGKPALELYKTYLGDRAAGLPGTALLFPLQVRAQPNVKDGGKDGEALVRTILAVDEATQSMTFAGDLPENGVARLMRANTDKLIGSAGLAARQASDEVGGLEGVLVISVSCVGRRLVLGERTDEEVEIVRESAPQQASHVGFYSYGEIAPALRGGHSELHNQTMTVTVFAEA